MRTLCYILKGLEAWRRWGGRGVGRFGEKSEGESRVTENGGLGWVGSREYFSGSEYLLLKAVWRWCGGRSVSMGTSVRRLLIVRDWRGAAKTASLENLAG